MSDASGRERRERNADEKGGASELLLETDIAFSRHTAEYSSGSSSTELRICGIGKSGKLSCTAPIEVGRAESSQSHDHEEPADDQPPEPYSEHLSVWRSKISFLPDGRVQVEDSNQAGRSNPLRGTHTLAFP